MDTPSLVYSDNVECINKCKNSKRNQYTNKVFDLLHESKAYFPLDDEKLRSIQIEI